MTKYDGLPTRIKLQKHLPTVTEETRKEINILKQELVLKIAEKFARENPIHVELLKTLKRQGYLIVVASNSIRNFIDKMMAKTKLKPYLDFSLSNEDVTLPKPNPEIYLSAIKRLKCSPKEIIIFEDNHYGLEAASATGAHVFHVKNINDVCYSNVEKLIKKINTELNYEKI